MANNGKVRHAGGEIVAVWAEAALAVVVRRLIALKGFYAN